jgi:hypothetical protein
MLGAGVLAVGVSCVAPVAASAVTTISLKGYTYVEADVSLPADGQGAGVASCPAGDAVIGGGAYQVTAGLRDNINSSYPEDNGSGWAVNFNNAGPATDTGVIVAFCATATSLKDYSVQYGALASIPAGGEGQGLVTCPTGTVSLDGGAINGGTKTYEAMVASAPDGTNGWRTYLASSGTQGTEGQAAAVCATQPSGWAQVASSYKTNPAGKATLVTVNCPGATHVIGGGPFNSSDAPTVTVGLTTSLSTLKGWHSKENNKSTSSESVDEWAICATTVAAS